MTDVRIAPSGAGWYPDPEGTGTTRFFDGGEWTQHVKGPPKRSTAPADAPVHQTGVVLHAALPRNGVAVAAFASGIAAVPLSLLIVPSVLGIVLGGAGMARAGRIGGAGRRRAAAGLLLGLLGLLLAAVQLVLLIPMLLAAQHHAQMAEVRSTVIAESTAAGMPLSDVRCPDFADLGHPGPFECDAVTPRGRHVRIGVLVEPGGAWSWHPEP